VAAWIARFHRGFSPLHAKQLGARAGTLVYDEDFYWLWLGRAQRFARGDAHKRRVLDEVERGYAPLVERLMALPQTVIHGEFYASNVMVRRVGSARVCPLDWEMTGIGPGLIDLAALTAGWAAPTRRALARAYLAAAAMGNGSGPAAGGRVRLSREFMADLDRCRLHLAVRMLGWSNDWEPPKNHAHNWLAEAERLSRRLQH
jgi:aminoglycoside phosphotransferase (APT) family kinase protein